MIDVSSDFDFCLSEVQQADDHDPVLSSNLTMLVVVHDDLSFTTIAHQYWKDICTHAVNHKYLSFKQWFYMKYKSQLATLEKDFTAKKEGKIYA